MTKMSEEKTSKWKMWAVIISSVLGAYATVVSTLIQTTGAKQSSVEALAKQNQEMLTQLNNVVLPELDNKAKEQTEYLIIIRERLAKMEGRLDGISSAGLRYLRRNNSNRNSGASLVPATTPKPYKEEIKIESALKPLSKIQIQQSPQIQQLLDATDN